MASEKDPKNDLVTELGEGDIEIVGDADEGLSKPDMPDIAIEDLFSFGPSPGNRTVVPDHGDEPIILEPEPVRAPTPRTLERILLHESWSFCHVTLPAEYRVDEKEFKDFSKESGFSVTLIGHMITLGRTPNADLDKLMNLFQLLFGTGVDIAIRFFPQGIEFHPNRP